MTNDESKAADAMQIVEASFVAASGFSGQLPGPTHAEVAFAGRSNVGKSSLINVLLERKNLVRTGATPGVTRSINLYSARARDGAVFHLVDWPGYGFTRRSKSEQVSWKQLIETYVRTRATLSAVVLLIDVRRGLEPDDIELIQWIEGLRGQDCQPTTVIVVATKLDKVKSSARRLTLQRLDRAMQTQLGERKHRNIIGFSSVTKEGREALWGAIRLMVFQRPETSS